MHRSRTTSLAKMAPRALASAALLPCLGLGLLAGLASAQGSNSCASATPIVGLGVYAFDNNGATFDGSSCPAGSDVWFAWTATTTDTVIVSTCGLASFDTYLGAFDGISCPVGSPIACNDDSCGTTRSEITFAAVAGQSYLIEVGGFQGAQGTGSFEVSVSVNGCANPVGGPDVIVGDVSGCSTYGSVGGVSAYSLGTTSCNVGDTELDWISNQNRHPVIGQNIFRLNDGRFEQLGQSWLKHGFFALQQNLCCTCITSSSGGSRLGVGCSDPYGSSLNGRQSGLGPRSEVNATTGDYLYPFGSQGQSGDDIYKRCQVPTADMNPANFPNAEYFGDSQYVAPDDATAGNGTNNVSWRTLTRSGSMTGGAYRLQVAGQTHRAEPALMAWQASDPAVDLVEVDIPNEGRFWVASHCFMDASSGQYRYEYCINNLNSHRSAMSLTIPVGASTPISGMGMSFPISHSGEPYDNTTWSAAHVGGDVVWSTDDFATNADANAIRWGTTYSFWFTSSQGPESKLGTIGLFRPGPQADPLVGLCGPIGGGGVPVVSHYCTAVPNSTGVVGTVDAQNIDLTARTMDLTAADLPANTFAFSLASLDSGFIQAPGGSIGNICLGGMIGRAVGGAILSTGATGTLSEGVNLDAVPQPMNTVVVLSGDTWHFQFWHRDTLPGGGAASSNFTGGVRVMFP